MFGLGEGVPLEIGWGVAEEGSGQNADVSNSACPFRISLTSATQREAVLMPYVRVLSSFRDDVRKKAMEKVPHSEFLELTDRLRDEELVSLGVALDDQEGTHTVFQPRVHTD